MSEDMCTHPTCIFVSETRVTAEISVDGESEDSASTLHSPIEHRAERLWWQSC